MATPPSRSHSASPDDDKPAQAPATIEVTANGHRRSLEALYIELRELAQWHGLEIEYKLSKSKPR